MTEAATRRLWWQDGVIYHIYPLSFADSNGDGLGDLQGIIQHLDYLNDGTPNSLGVDALWLSPVFCSPKRDFGYDVSNYQEIDPVFGSMADFDQLLVQAHRRGIRIIMDLVLNHTSDQHRWFVASRSNREDPKRDWYIWQDGNGSKQPPNNWLSTFGGSAWTWDEVTGQWYLHGFLPEQPDVNWRNPAVKEAMFDIVRFWLDRGVDGFRLDVVNHYIKDAQFRDNPRRSGFHLRPYERQWHIYDKDRPELHPILRELRRVIDGYPERMTVGEVHSDHYLEVSAALYGQDNDELHMAFNFDFRQCPWHPRAFQEVVTQWESLLPPGAWPNYVLSNHDVTRHYSRYGKGQESTPRAKVAAALLLTLRGTPFLYYGEEIGMRQTHIPRHEILDPPGRRFWPFFQGRDGCRTPMQWQDAPYAGFSTVQPWLRVNSDYTERNVLAQEGDEDSLLNFYRAVIWLRKSLPALQRGEFVPLQKEPEQVLSFLRRTEAQTLWIVLNFAGRPVRYVPDQPLPSRHWRVHFSTAGRNGTETTGLSAVLAPYEISILEAI